MQDMNSGYKGWSMSKRAEAAYACGEAPKSKWTKKAMAAAIKGFCGEWDLRYDPRIEGLAKDALFSGFFTWSGWHHTSKFANETDFYELDEDAVRGQCPEMTEEQIARAREERRAEHEAALARGAAWRAEREAFEQAHGFASNSLAAYVELHPENVVRRTSLKGNEIIEIPRGRDAIRAGIYQARRAGEIRMRGFDALDGAK